MISIAFYLCGKKCFSKWICIVFCDCLGHFAKKNDARL